jgi:hypothetical protein
MRVMNIVVKWYASGTFWTAAGVVVAVLVGVAGALVAYTVGFPRRRLLYGMPVAAAMLTAPSGVRGDLELHHRDTVLTAPHVLEIRLVSRGRKDIPSSAYDSGKPLRLDVGARIVEVLQTTSDPPSIPAPSVTVDGTSLMIGPGLISKRQKITFTVLTDGERPNLTCQSTLIDVQVRQQDSDDLQPASTFATVFATVAVLAMIGGVWSLAAASTQRTVASAAGAAASVAARAAANDESTARAALSAAAVARKAAELEARKAQVSASKSDPISAQTAKASADIAQLQASVQTAAAHAATAAAGRDRSTARALAAVQASASATAQADALRARALGVLAAVAAVAALAVGVVLLRRWSRR